MMPAAPLVGAVTTRPPAAFSSLTAMAYRLTQSITDKGSDNVRSARCVRLRYSSGARRRTRSGPGNSPSASG
ncbi:hypothetical protein D3C81_2268110 [compost metagenome]